MAEASVGIYGGSFDPIHLGHLIAAEQIREQCGLDKIVFIPANNPPHKEGQTLAPSLARFSMVATACAPNPYFEVSDIEIRRGGTSYSVDTLKELEKTFGTNLALVVGSDMVMDLASWKEINQIIRRWRLIVAERPGYDVKKIMRYQMIGTTTSASTQKIIEKLESITFPGLDISSTEIRRRIRAGQSIRHLVPTDVETIIRSRGLYSEGEFESLS